MKCGNEYECPYSGQVSEDLLCKLWEEIQLQLSIGSTPSPDYEDLIGSSVGASGGIPYGDCPYLTDKNPIVACLLWCELRSVAMAENCTDPPVCPYEDRIDPYDDTLCKLWSELEGLRSSTNQSSTIGPGAGGDITCPYLSSPEYSDEMCSMWCEIQSLKDDKICREPCPYENDPEYDLACQYWERLNELEDASRQGSSEFDIVVAAETFMGSVGGSGVSVTCVDKDNPTSAQLLCNLWCKIQDFYGLEC